eukprot:SAG25_NODE_13772_length_263_cov_0.634146_1_plen_29_part_01
MLPGPSPVGPRSLLCLYLIWTSWTYFLGV